MGPLPMTPAKPLSFEVTAVEAALVGQIETAARALTDWSSSGTDKSPSPLREKVGMRGTPLNVYKKVGDSMRVKRTFEEQRRVGQPSAEERLEVVEGQLVAISAAVNDLIAGRTTTAIDFAKVQAMQDRLDDLDQRFPEDLTLKKIEVKK